MRFLNLTPHDITFIHSNEEVIIPKSGQLARVVNTFENLDIGGVPVKVKASAVIEGLGEPQEGQLIIVSGFVRSELSGRPDVVSPGTGPDDGPRRNEKGWITGVICFVR